MRSTLDYACFLFHEAPSNLLKKLNVVQNNALRIISGCFRTTPINVLHHICDINYLSHRRVYLIQKFVLKNFMVSDNPLFPKMQYVNQLLSNRPRIYNKLSFSFNTAKEFFNQELNRGKILPTFQIPFKALFIDNHIIFNNLNVKKTQFSFESNIRII